MYIGRTQGYVQNEIDKNNIRIDEIFVLKDIEGQHGCKYVSAYNAMFSMVFLL